MKNLLQNIFSVKNEKSHKVITIFFVKLKFFNGNKAIKNIEKEILNLKKKIRSISTDVKKIEHISTDVEKIEHISTDVNKIKNESEEMYKMNYLKIKEKPWRNIKLALSDVSARETSEFIIQNNLLNLKTFSDRLDLHTYAIKQVEKHGLYLEFGVYVGKSINHIAKQKTNEKIYGFDSFEGLPESWYGIYKKGIFKMKELPKVEQNVELVKGYFEDTLPTFVQEQGNFDIAYLNIDCDLYSSTKTIFDNLKGHISKGTVIYFDEYWNYPGWQQHEYRAFMEFLDETGLKFEYIGYVYDAEKVAIKII